ncbi:MAG: hypothetical protein J7L34_02020 [Thermotogaceae bacterium]|nr:hypothetical protein [Thermotogaceae bacterium]
MRRFASYYSKDSYEIVNENEDKAILKSPYPAEHREASSIYLYTYPSGGTKGTLLFVHGLGQHNLKYLKYFPEKFSKLGYSSALMILPYHFDRTPQGYKSGEMFLNTTDNDALRSRFEHVTVDVLTSLDYLKDKFGYPLYLMGYSFGGMISTIASAFRHDLSGLSLVVSGGNFYYITWESVVTKVFRVQYEQNQECSREKCRMLHSRDNFYKYIEELKNPSIELNTAPMKCYEYDPLSFAKFVKAKTVVFTALLDVFIPFRSSNELYRHLGSSSKKRYLLPAGHITSFLLWRKFIVKATDRFFKKGG